MTKHFIKQRPFSQLFSEKSEPGQFLENSERLDLPFLNQLSVFETLRVYEGNFFHLPQHWQRLEWSCGGLGRTNPLSLGAMTDWVRVVLVESGWKNAMMRVSIHWESASSGVVLAMAREFTSYPAALYQKGVELRTAVTRRPELQADNPQIKCSQYVAGVLAFLDDAERSAHELLFLGSGGYVAEGSISNIFIIKGKRVLTPSLASGILSGVTRAFVADLCRERGFEVLETFFTRHEIYNAEECFMTNTSSEILPVVRVDGRVIGSGLPGTATKILAEDFKIKLKVELHDKN